MSRGVPPIDLPDALDPEEDRATEGWGPFLRYDLPAIIACLAIWTAWLIATGRLG